MSTMVILSYIVNKYLYKNTIGEQNNKLIICCLFGVYGQKKQKQTRNIFFLFTQK